MFPQCLNLPSESRSSSEKSTASRVRHDELTQTPILSAITLPHHHTHPLNGKAFYIFFWIQYETIYIRSRTILYFFNIADSMNIPYEDRQDDGEGERCPYVHLSAVSILNLYL